MKLALVIEHYDAKGGGAERWTDQHARRLIEQGIDVHLVARSFHGAPEAAHCHAVSHRSTRRRRLAFAAEAERLLDRLGADVVVDMGAGWSGDVFLPHHGTRAGGWLQNELLVPTLARPVDRAIRRWSGRYREFAALERRQFEFHPGKRFVALSRRIANDFVRFYGVPTEAIDLIPNGVDAARFTPPTTGQRDSARLALGICSETVFLIIAHNFRLKGVPALIRAFARLDRQRGPFRLLVAGKEWSRPYQWLARRLGCAQAVHFLGNQPDPLPLYHAADVYVQPTLYDPCSLVVLEALACGLPVITSEQNGASELLSHAAGSVLADPTDVATLAERMNEFCDAARRETAGRAARLIAEQNTLARNTERLLDLYRGHRRASAA